MRNLFFGALVLFGSLSTASAQIVVHTGDDLEAIVDSAPNGSVIEIQSDATFNVTLKFGYTWTKNLTLQAGAGFTPTLKGTTTGPVKVQADAMQLAFTGLRIEAAVPGGTAVKITDQPAVTPGLTQVTFTDCVLDGELPIRLHPTNPLVLDIVDSQLTGPLTTTRTAGGAPSVTLTILGSTVADIDTGGSLGLPVAGLLEDSVVLGPVEDHGADSIGNVSDWMIRRTRIDGRVLLVTAHTLPVAVMQLENCLLVGPAGPSPGLYTVGPGGTKLTAINCTVTGFQIGAWVDEKSKLINCLFTGNTQADVQNTTFPHVETVFSSYLSAGPAIGLNGNFTGVMLLDGDFMQLPGSAGIDAGDTSIVPPGATDLLGGARIIDGLGDGVAVVDVGAIESPNPLNAKLTVFNGSGINPNDFTGTLPAIGSMFHGTVAKTPSTILTVMAIDSPSIVPFQLPGWSGEVLVAASPLLILDFANGNHFVPIPNDVALIGGLISAQGARIELTGIFTETVLLNRLDLVLGL
jgi:hypothetical protein